MFTQVHVFVDFGVLAVCVCSVVDGGEWKGFLSKCVIFLVHNLTNIVPFLPKYGRCIQTVGTCSSC